jgi:hypothetical protein
LCANFHCFILISFLLLQEVINECNFEQKFKVNVLRNRESGEVEAINKLSKADVEFHKFLTPHGKVREKTRSTANREKRKQKALEKAETKKEKRVDEFAKYRDDVKFGEVVHGPPQLTVLPRKSSRVDVCNVSKNKRELRKPTQL